MAVAVGPHLAAMLPAVSTADMGASTLHELPSMLYAYVLFCPLPLPPVTYIWPADTAPCSTHMARVAVRRVRLGVSCCSRGCTSTCAKHPHQRTPTAPYLVPRAPLHLLSRRRKLLPRSVRLNRRRGNARIHRESERDKRHCRRDTQRTPCTHGGRD